MLMKTWYSVCSYVWTMVVKASQPSFKVAIAPCRYIPMWGKILSLSQSADLAIKLNQMRDVVNVKMLVYELLIVIICWNGCNYSFSAT